MEREENGVLQGMEGTEERGERNKQREMARKKSGRREEEGRMERGEKIVSKDKERG